MRAWTARLLVAALAAAPLCGAVAQPSGDGAGPAASGDRSYTPGYEPRADHNNPEYDANYDANKDPDHPLKRDEDPGEEWDTNTRYDGTPKVLRGNADWPWGELVYGQAYKTKILITNHCASTETVTLTPNNLPYLSVPSTVTIPPKRTVEVDATITTPPEPSVPMVTGHETLPPGGIFVDITGDTENLVIWHPWSPPCMPKRETFKVSGHVHFASPAGGPSGPQKVAGAGPCEVWWNTGQRPRNAKNDCTDEIRTLALHYRERVLQHYAGADPAAWAWLPGGPAIRGMALDELLGLKRRADALTRDASKAS